MCWREINPDGTSWTIPKERSKNGRAHTLPLLPEMREIIEAVPHIVGRNQLFGTRGGGFTAWSLGKKQLDARSGVEDWTTHDIRRTVSTRMGDLGILPHVIEVILNHVSGHKAGDAGTYNRSLYANEVRSAFLRWHDYVRTLVDGVERKVIAMPQVAS